jgi:hypothetical protein
MRRAILCVPLLAASVLAQGKTFESPQGFRLKLPRTAVEETRDPKDRIVLGKFLVEVDKTKCAFWVARYRTAAAPATDDGGKGGGEAPQSLKDQAIAAYNNAHSLQQLLDLRFGEGKYPCELTKEKPVKTKDGAETHAYDSNGEHTHGVLRAFVGAVGGEEFALIGFGNRDKEWDKLLEQLVESLEFFTPAAPAGVAPAVAADLRDPAFRQQVRSNLQQGWDAHDTTNFILITNCTNKAVVKGLLTDLEIMRKCYLERFPPAGAMAKVSLVRVFASYEEYARYGKLDGAIGHFSPIDDELVLFDPGKKIPKRSEWLKDVDTAEVLYHEAMHQYLHEANGHLAPASWFGEGFGEVFAGAVLDRRQETVTKIERNKGRMIWIKRSQKSGGWPDLRAFVRMSQREFYGPSVYQNYAFAWAFCNFLEEQRKDPRGNKEWGAIPDQYLATLREITDDYRKKLPAEAPKDWIMAVQGEIQEKTFAKVFATTDWGALEKGWIEAMKKW